MNVCTLSSQHGDFIQDLSYHLHGSLLATASSDQKTRIWLRAPHQTSSQQQTEPSVERSEAHAGFQLECELSGHTGSLSRLSWSAPTYGTLLASGSSDRLVLVYQRSAAAQWKLRARLSDAMGAITCVTFSPPHLGLLLAATSTDGRLRVYECTDFQSWSSFTLTHDIEIGANDCHAVAFNSSPFEPASVAVAMQSTVRVLVLGPPGVSSLKQQQTSMLLPGGADTVHDVAWANSCGRSHHRIATASKDGAVRVYTLQYRATEQQWSTPKLVSTLRSHQSPVWRVSWNITGTLLSSSGDDGKTRLYQSNFQGEFTEILAARAAYDFERGG